MEAIFPSFLSVERESSLFFIERESRRVSRKERKMRMLEQQEIAPEDIIIYDDIVLGTGGFATVQLAEYQQTAVAAKVVSIAGVCEDDRAKEKIAKLFVSELHAMLTLRSDHTVNVFGAITSDSARLVLVMEFVEGKQ